MARGICRIFEDTKIVDLVGNMLIDITGAVFSLHTEQNHEPAANLPDGRAIDHQRRPTTPRCTYGSHASKLQLTAARPSNAFDSERLLLAVAEFSVFGALESEDDAARARNSARRVEPCVEQMARRHVGERLEHRLLHAGMLGFELHEQPLGALALQAQIAAGRAAAADDRQLALLAYRRAPRPRRRYTSGRITTCAPSSDTSLAGIALSAPAKNRFSSSVSMKSSA